MDGVPLGFIEEWQRVSAFVQHVVGSFYRLTWLISMFEAVHRFFGTARWRKTEATRLAAERFPTFDPKAAALVLQCLVEMLGINFEQLHPDTDLAIDLAADEDEPQWFCFWFRYEVGIALTPKQIIDAKTVGGMINLISTALERKNQQMKTSGC